MHPEAIDFLRRMKQQYPGVFRGKILECGSLDVNGNPRGFFDATEYVGIDWRAGPAVDEVSLIHEYRGHPDGYFDTVVSMETLEHDPHWALSLKRMVELVKIGGSLLVTCAGPGREPHCVETSPEPQYYQNRTSWDLLFAGFSWRFLLLENDPVAKDLRMLAVGKGKEGHEEVRHRG